MDRIKMYQKKIRELGEWRRTSKCKTIRAECSLEIAQCQLTIAAIRYGLSLGYGKGGKP